MQRKLILPALALGVLLCACAEKTAADPAQQALDFRQKIQQGICCFQAEITADYGQSVSRFSLSCTRSPDSGTTMVLTAPQTLAGITAQADNAGARLVFDDTEAAFGTLPGLGISPMAAPEQMALAWQSGYIRSAGTENGQLYITYLNGYGENETRVDTWFQDGVPVRAELSHDGQTTVQIDVTDFTIRKAEKENESTQKNMGRYLAGQSGA